MSKQIQWFPGHMAKTLREFKETTKKVNVFFVLVDARAPKSSFIDSFNELITNKKVVVLLTKADLVEKKELQKWVEHYKNKYGYAFTLSLTNKQQVRKELLKILNGIKFKSLLPKLAILGVPNVGKSTLLNIFAQGQKANAENRAGVTKSNTWYQFNNKYWVMDTPGVLQPKFTDEAQGLKLAAIGSIKQDILPLHDVVQRLAHLLAKKNIDIGFGLDTNKINRRIDEEIHNTSTSTSEFYKQIIIKFQKSKFGKIILD